MYAMKHSVKRTQVKKTFRYMIDVNVLANQEGLKKLVKKEGLK